jgi:hypothetical protein
MEGGPLVGRHMRPRRWTERAQARKLASVIGQLRHSCLGNERAAAYLGLANGPGREESARLTVELLSSLRQSTVSPRTNRHSQGRR